MRLRRRMWILLWVFTSVFGLFILRLMWLQLGEPVSLLDKRSIVERSVRQRMEKLVLDQGRGEFVDRYGRTFMGQRQQALAFFPAQYQEFNDDTQKKIAEILNVSTEDWRTWTEQAARPKLWSEPLRTDQIEELQKLNTPGMYVVEWKERYPEPYIAGHVLGFTAEQPKRLAADYKQLLSEQRLQWNSPLGASGLEYSLDPLLVGMEETYVFHWVDGKNRPVGKGLRIHQPDATFYPLQVFTTLDYDVQAEVERLMEQSEMKKGSVIVLDSQNADIVAMASRPAFHPGRPQRTSEAIQHWDNRALKAIAPGSVYKIVTAAAALEAGIDSSLFTLNSYSCSGTYHRYGLTCWKHGGHGNLTLMEAFAQSCNIAFAEIGEQLTEAQFLQTANKLRVLSPVGWRQEDKKTNFSLLLEESSGKLFGENADAQDGGTRAQSAIGQRDVKITPLQAANLIVTILHDGVVRQPRVVSHIQYQNGGKVKSFPEQKLIRRRDSISPRTARWLRKAMREVVVSGTGKMLEEATWELAGKSGTAETEQVIEGVPRDHQWFVGYGPVTSPKYVVAVVFEDVPETGDHLATKLFGDVMNYLAAIDQEKR